ncbi:hypothetical protein [Chitinimonas sp. BJYL2]|uniref:hypothetical protein n=1 Tax=Chitinimonas sp. BJYL2 TaxID=2976696 RepID=UPI0022B4FD72|nr:hypothetical protein [Chitinimonas sp. BJYL2]
MTTRVILIAILLGLTGCDRVNELASQAKMNGQAIGAACRHSGRNLEDCYRRNARVSKADIFAGWKQMNEYMAKNSLDVVPPPADQPKGTGPASSVDIGGGTEPESTEAPAPVTDKPAATTESAPS